MSGNQTAPSSTSPSLGVEPTFTLATTLLVRALNLETLPQDIDPEAPLYGDGLGLDSIDILEVALIVSKQYGIQLRADAAENQQTFRSLRHLAEYIAAHRTK